MTARHQLRIGNRRLGRDRSAIDATPPPRVGETLQLARERKGVDLFRAERDTKIRLRYLAALEDGAYDDLPAPVYTKGFLRNYAIYLGIDPDEIIERWREEMESIRAVERIAVAPPPQPIAAPRRTITISPGMFVTALVGLVVVAFIGYIAIQLVRYVETTPVDVTRPANAFSTVASDTESFLIEGTSGPGAHVTIRGPGGALYDDVADETGLWSVQVPLTRGQNDFTITAMDPVTKRESAESRLTIAVALPSHGAPQTSPQPTQAPPAPLQLNLTAPTDGFISPDGNVTVGGTTSASRVRVESVYLGEPLATPPPLATPGASIAPTAEPSRTPQRPPPSELPLSSPAPQPTGSLAPTGPARDITVPDSGSFAETLSFPVGRWAITITASGIGVDPVAETRTITVSPPMTSGIALVISVEGRDSWVRLLADGVRVGGFGTLRVGEVKTVTAVNEVCLRTGNAGGLRLNLNGLDIGLLGRSGQVGSWIIRPGQAPEPAPAPC